jgi:hypothetical protein
MSDLLRLDRQPIPVGAVCLALTNLFLHRGRLLVALSASPLHRNNTAAVLNIVGVETLMQAITA